MNLRFFILYSLLIVMGLAQTYSYFKSYFSEEKYLAAELGELKKEYQDSLLKNQLLSYQFSEFKQEVAVVLPRAIKEDPYDYSKRNLASVVEDSAALKFEPSLNIFNKAKKLFGEKKYENAVFQFNKIVSNYPDSIQMPESLFLMGESYYQMKEYPRAMDAIEILMQQFPAHILTGFALIRLGKIYEKNDLPQDAELTYKLVLEHFPNKDLQTQARKKIQGLSL